MSDIHLKARLHIQYNGTALDLEIPAGETTRIDLSTHSPGSVLPGTRRPWVRDLVAGILKGSVLTIAVVGTLAVLGMAFLGAGLGHTHYDASPAPLVMPPDQAAKGYGGAPSPLQQAPQPAPHEPPLPGADPFGLRTR